MSRRKQPPPLTGYRLKEWREFEKRKAEEAAGLAMAKKLASKVRIHPRQFPAKSDKAHRTPNFRIAQAFRPGHGKLS